jgi:hypothetical protein
VGQGSDDRDKSEREDSGQGAEKTVHAVGNNHAADKSTKLQLLQAGGACRDYGN